MPACTLSPLIPGHRCTAGIIAAFVVRKRRARRIELAAAAPEAGLYAATAPRGPPPPDSALGPDASGGRDESQPWTDGTAALEQGAPQSPGAPASAASASLARPSAAPLPSQDSRAHISQALAANPPLQGPLGATLQWANTFRAAAGGRTPAAAAPALSGSEGPNDAAPARPLV